MQLPIPIGTILQNRYRIVEVLGQGGFGRTYLAEDQGRFRELCALKELIPAQNGDYALEKSRELFQREATTLHQIQHPQIPKFVATFEQDQRLFMVQEYVEGQTYRAILDARKSRGYTFSETEIVQLLQQLLPVLAYIHTRGIIHRDIAPDNIILREQDHLPVLIDFGVVKELATRFQQADTGIQATTVGKPGYAPSEQIQTGRAFPSSDLYALAVTTIVLLTGRDPQELFNESTLSWNWQRWVAVNSRLAQILNQMLKPSPTDRYQSADEVLFALQNLNSPALPVAPASAMMTGGAAGVTQAATVAIGGQRPLPRGAANIPDSTIPTPQVRSFWEDPLAVISIGTAMALAAGFGSWAIVSALLSKPQPQPTPTETVVVSPVPTTSPSPKPASPSPTVRPTPVNYSQRLRLTLGEPSRVNGSLRANQTVSYIFSGQEGQQLDVSTPSEGVLLSVLAPSGEPVDANANRVNRWNGTLPFTGDYAIQVKPVKGIDRADYRLKVALAEPAPTPTPTPTSSPSASPSPNLSPSPSLPETVEVSQVDFPAGKTQTRVSGRARPEAVKRYLVTVQQGQVLSVEVIEGSVTLDIRRPDGQLIQDAARILSWQSQVDVAGEYQIDVIATSGSGYTLDVSVRD
ncbi:serine/threonine protein kinase [Leptolyngbya sp. 'hensonii']|uniref:serine/threonine-protein kinase n=1 Tax=Leptolyngbya sp. 'hensonii' TaxID=1922337 RepID=UPI00094FDEB4|nr:serine/threonine-protein kinase [Leptolyngbya sp. 'hensonii']OLP17524.1 serine/threonine protein kinase [Leptolyngbya sp. 'hensonii']